MPKDPLGHVSLKLLSLLVGVFENRGMVGSSKISDQLLGDGDLVLFRKSPRLSIG
jgi:hypothetical protein